MIARPGQLAPPDIDYDSVWGSESRNEFAPFLRSSRSRVVRQIQQFAEQEIIIPTGPRAGLKFDVDVQPFFKLLWDEFSNPYWNEYAITGCTQTGKSFGGFAAPVFHCVAERREDAIISAPTKEILQDKVKRDLMPLILASPRYAHLWPTKGGGSKGGVPDLIELANGCVIKLMSFEGGDKSKASFTCPNIFITEVDGEKASLTSQEAKALEQIVARARATSRDRRFILYECTVSVEDGPIWQLIHTKGSGGRIMLPCPRCGEFVRPDREDLKGWQEAKSVIQAEDMSAWHCPECSEPWTEDERYEANLKAKLVHRGQSINKAGKIFGELPETRTLGFRFSAVNSMFLPVADIGVDCWEARENPDEVDAEKKLTQFVFALPYEPPGLDEVKFKPEDIEKRKSKYPQGVVPPNTIAITVGGDLGKYRNHWVATAWVVDKNQRRGIIIDYGTIELNWLDEDGKKITAKEVGYEQVFSRCMGEWKERIDRGWVKAGTKDELASYDAMWIDARWQGDDDPEVDVLYDWIREQNDSRVMSCMGHASNQIKRSAYKAPRINPKTGAGGAQLWRRGHHYHIDFVPEEMLKVAHIDADKWKIIVQSRIVTNPDNPGSLILFDSMNPREHQNIVKHFGAEKLKRHFDPKKGQVEEFTQVREANHYLDATAYCCAAGHFKGYRTRLKAEKPKQKKATQARSRAVRGRDGRAFVASQR